MLEVDFEHPGTGWWAVISDIAGETGSASSLVLSAAQSMARDSDRLKLEVVKFLNSVRAA